MTTPDRTGPAEVAESLRDAPASDWIVEFGRSARQVDDASSKLQHAMLTHARTEPRCPECDDLERGRKRAAAARDLSRVTDFNVLLARHRARHQTKQ
ncbi:hypothetical protein Sgleb_29980 [Streptomyces glebosus]|uniref:Uncharacterized protein n=1 Tax=Streptomyces glebosus TaxID=249580 RepID=A0A640SXH0_9ACTN|nr:hypothetical protein [Streptomyces glebosus]GFE14951.1 hypothetical protein Sgleb_29980 [Streptomyces glebosus]GHG61696.1 hypothetical protein GCM10010513_28140 [Streptomyces glebosus]